MTSTENSVGMEPEGRNAPKSDSTLSPKGGEAEAVAGEAYQVVGVLASAAGLFDHPEVIRALDYFSGDLADEILPFGDGLEPTDQPAAWRYRFVTSKDGKEWSDWFIVDDPALIPPRANPSDQIVQPLCVYPAAALSGADRRLLLNVAAGERQYGSDRAAALIEALTHPSAQPKADRVSASPEAIGGGSLGSSLRDTQPGADGAVVVWPTVTDAWAETYCELTGKDPDGQQVTFVDGGKVTTFRDMAKREIEAMLCAAPKAAVRALSAATPVQRGGEGWQPIETAPRDVRAILFTPAERLYEKPHPDDWEMRVARPRDWGWATHWMPLPSAPTPAEQQDRNNG